MKDSMLSLHLRHGENTASEAINFRRNGRNRKLASDTRGWMRALSPGRVSTELIIILEIPQMNESRGLPPKCVSQIKLLIRASNLKSQLFLENELFSFFDAVLTDEARWLRHRDVRFGLKLGQIGT